MAKKGQVGVYVILGFIIFVGIVFMAYLTNKGKSQQDISNIQGFDVAPIRLYVQNCVKNTASEALISIGKQGGFNQLKKPYLAGDGLRLPYYLYNGVDLTPSLGIIAKEIDSYIEHSLPLCLKELEEYKLQGFDIDQGPVKSSSSIGVSSVDINLQFPLALNKEGNTINLEKFSSSIQNFHLKTIAIAFKEIISQQTENPNSVCLSCLYDLAGQKNLFIDIIKYGDDSIIFQIEDYNVSEDNIIKRPYNYTFAVKLMNISCDNFVRSDDDLFIQRCADEKIANSIQEIKFEEIPDFRLKIGQSFEYAVKAEGKNLIFSDYSWLFDISPSGLIKFTPDLGQIGNHTVFISAKDVLGNEKFKNFIIEIEE